MIPLGTALPKKKKKKKAQASQHTLRKESLVVTNSYHTVTERMKAVIIFKSSGTMQVHPFQSKERQNDQSYLKNGAKEIRPYLYHEDNWFSGPAISQSVQPDPKKLNSIIP